jgi:hypothetical protein
MEIKIYDMDGTIVCSLHRYRTMPCRTRIDLQFWRDNEHLAEMDSLLPLAKQYQEDIKNPNCYVIIATARIIREPDMRFIQNVLGMPNYIISRKDNDNQSGASLKIKGLQKFFNLKQFKKASAVFFEDNVAYLKAVCDRFNIQGVYIPSNQGH